MIQIHSSMAEVGACSAISCRCWLHFCA